MKNFKLILVFKVRRVRERESKMKFYALFSMNQMIKKYFS